MSDYRAENQSADQGKIVIYHYLISVNILTNEKMSKPAKNTPMRITYDSSTWENPASNSGNQLTRESGIYRKSLGTS